MDAQIRDGLKLGVDSLGEQALVTVRGELDIATAGLFAGVLHAVVSDGCRDLVIDCGGVTFIDAAGLRGLVHTALRLHRAGGSLTIDASSTQFRRLLDLTGVSNLIEYASPNAMEPHVMLEYRNEVDLADSGANPKSPSSTTTMDRHRKET
jgi:anti-sigma B factor antagonist